MHNCIKSRWVVEKMLWVTALNEGVKFNNSLGTLIVFWIINILGVWIVARFGQLLGLEITSLLWVLVLAFVADAVQRIVWRLVAKPARV